MNNAETLENEHRRLRKLRGREIALATMPNSPLWIKAQEYRRKLGLGQTQFQHLKSLGKFDKGTDPATLGTKRIRIHAWFNYMLQDFVAPGLTELASPNKPRRKIWEKQQRTNPPKQ